MLELIVKGVPIAAPTIALFTLAWSIWNANRTRLLDVERFEWERLNELASALYNKDNDYGRWRQELAIRELAQFARKRVEALALLAQAEAYFRGRASDEALDEDVRRAAFGLLIQFDNARNSLFDDVTH